MIDKQLLEDTIAAVATPVGRAGIGIIRISGSRACHIAKRIFRPHFPTKELLSHRLYLGHIIDPATETTMDEVLLSIMKAPCSYTREDVVEVNSHSGHLVLSKILEIIMGEGARIAKPGEFTFRAYINGRIDLTQAEAVVDLINSQSDRGLQLATQQMAGALKKEIEAFRNMLLDILAQIEAAIDFPDDEPAIISRDQTVDMLQKELLDPIQRIISAHAQRKIWMDGVNTVIVGRVNVGKSSLLNRLIDEKKAIVTPIPGTTRDVIEATVHMGGIPLRLMDTAGFRKVRGKVERIGIRLTEQKLSEADLPLILIDQSRPLSQEDLDILDRSDKDKALIIVNKADLPSKLEKGDLEKAAGDIPMVKISALTGEGIEELRSAIVDRLLSGETDFMSSNRAVPNLRHKEALQEVSRLLKTATENLRADLPLDIVAVDLQGGVEALGEIIGETTHEDLLDRIFSRFCLGK
ncbi:MAG: tRNA uridine-5-carboxymethylaminomethyl(34) synthesis GTPase MnmE [Desulfatiglandales bacterium]